MARWSSASTTLASRVGLWGYLSVPSAQDTGKRSVREGGKVDKQATGRMQGWGEPARQQPKASLSSDRPPPSQVCSLGVSIPSQRELGAHCNPHPHSTACMSYRLGGYLLAALPGLSWTVGCAQLRQSRTVVLPAVAIGVGVGEVDDAVGLQDVRHLRDRCRGRTTGHAGMRTRCNEAPEAASTPSAPRWQPVHLYLTSVPCSTPYLMSASTSASSGFQLMARP